MNRFFALLFIICSGCAAAATDIIPAEKMPLAQRALLLDIANVRDTGLVAVGEHGIILLSSDAKNWQQANVPVQTTLTAVYFVGEQGWAVGHDATILHSTDGGLHWQLQQYQPEIQKPLLDVMFNDQANGIAIGAYGQFYRTTDGGEHWTFEFHDEFLNPDDAQYLRELKSQDEEAYLDERASILPHFNRIVRDGRTLYLVGEIGLIAKSNDFGMHWQQVSDVYQGSFFDLARTQQGNLMVVGLRGHAFRSLSNGSAWQQLTTDTTALLNSIVLADDGRVFVLGSNGVLLESADDGQSFNKLMQPDGKALIAGVWFHQRIVAVSDVGIKTIIVK